jgi:hypothetical protein
LSIGLLAAPANAEPTAEASTLTPAKKCKKKQGKAKKKCLKKLQKAPIGAPPGFPPVIGAGCSSNPNDSKCVPTINLNCTNCHTGANGWPHQTANTPIELQGHLSTHGYSGAGVPLKLSYTTLPGHVTNEVTVYTDANGSFAHTYTSEGGYFNEYRSVIVVEFAGIPTHQPETITREVWIDKKTI